MKKTYTQAVTLNFGYGKPKSILETAEVHEGYEYLQSILHEMLTSGDKRNAAYSKALAHEDMHQTMYDGWKHPYILNEKGNRYRENFHNKILKDFQFLVKARHNLVLVAVREGFEVWELGKVDLLAVEKIHD